jgi:hypothetical protein
MTKLQFSTKHGILSLLGIAFLLYCLFQARFLILGPQVWITTPVDGEALQARVITASGQARNVAWMSLNGRQIFTDQDGNWSEKLIVSGGVSIMTVVVRDRFGREKEESVRVILN